MKKKKRREKWTKKNIARLAGGDRAVSRDVKLARLHFALSYPREGEAVYKATGARSGGDLTPWTTFSPQRERRGSGGGKRSTRLERVPKNPERVVAG